MVNYRHGANAQNSGIATLRLFTTRRLAYNPLQRPDGQDQPEDGMTKERTDTDVAFIQALAELLNANDLTELSVKREYGPDDRLDVKVSKHAAPVVQAAAPMQYAPAAAAAAPVAVAAPEDPAQHPGAVTSPMVGTVYLSAEPGAAPFVTVGATVAEGQTVLIIEAMKTMNHIPATRAGVVKRILTSDGSAVEYGAPLMIIE
jgi:acetyl-CoA carboxylase biotin carboxyl carrier protein